MKEVGPHNRALSLKDVAAVAGASTSTVSRVLSNQGAVSEAMRRRVLDAVHSTGYLPNATASALARRRSPKPGRVHNNVALAVAATGEEGFHRFWDETFNGVLEAADELEMNVSVCLIRPEEAEDALPPAALRRLHTDGILAGFGCWGGVRNLPRVAPTVLVGGPPAEPVAASSVEADAQAGVWRLVEHLAGLGHSRIEFVLLYETFPPYLLRAEAARKASAENGISCTVSAPVSGKVEGYVRGLLARPEGSRPTALLACNDNVAVEVLHALLAQGASVPGDMSVVGFDGRPWGEQSVPPLTSWHVHWHELGRKALHVLAELLERGTAPTRTLVGGELVVRDSTGPPPVPGAASGAAQGCAFAPGLCPQSSGEGVAHP